LREGVVVICDYLMKECQHILEKRNKRRWWVNPLNAELNPICHLLALLGGAIIVVVSRLRVKPWIMRRNILGTSNTLFVEWTSEDRDLYKNHLMMSREQFFELLSKVKPFAHNN